MAFVRGHSFGARELVGGAAYQQTCGPCGCIRRVTGGHVQWIDRDNAILPKDLWVYLERSCPGPIQQATLREYYKVKIEQAVEIAKRNALFWVHHIRMVYLPYLDRFSE